MKALLVAGGTPPGEDLLRQRAGSAQLVVAADRGLDVLLKYGLIPDILIGDFDSADPAALEKAQHRIPEILRAAREKNETDLELAATVLMRHGAAEICILGAMGGRIDHLLGNLAVLLNLHENGVTAVMEDEEQTVRIIDGGCSFTGKPGETVSLLPVGKAARVTAHGLYYPLDELLLSADSARGISNTVTEETVRIHTSSPLYLIRNAGQVAK